ncbi:ABC transporter ATP-binding protein [Labedaea rhizosphaerae]|uniref:Amino acid/amide ABC transporter ATP-binding protein 1 (HAAT family) n=1 Tax=Labedaea rhizosphaerae TaxID=598644 RepID=A0A4V3CZF2_LABRH|nr:ABC transporter ATP-binding protein [Labedaea rhizosphaerae]TDP97808.1 amino acid/amide ABC transporter ATP-binding protein 1 (HAAT family) [Labedaea rhizosphaerae]
MTNAEQPLLSVAGVTVRFGGLVALSDVSLEVAPRTVVGVIGPNGAGKTTLFNVVCGFVRPKQGTLSWRGTTLRNHRPDQLANLGIARTLQGLGLFAGLSVLHNVMAGADRTAKSGLAASVLGSRGAARGERDLRAKAMTALATLGIADTAHRYPGELPYGVQKRAALARALAAEPELLLLDEPASGLSEQDMAELVTHLRTLREDMAIMLVEHHVDLVMRVCDRVVVLNFGEVIAEGDPAKVRNDPLVTEAYLGDPARERDSA